MNFLIPNVWIYFFNNVNFRIFTFRPPLFFFFNTNFACLLHAFLAKNQTLWYQSFWRKLEACMSMLVVLPSMTALGKVVRGSLMSSRQAGTAYTLHTHISWIYWISCLELHQWVNILYTTVLYDSWATGLQIIYLNISAQRVTKPIKTYMFSNDIA